jgi:hypothetical protein
MALIKVFPYKGANPNYWKVCCQTRNYKIGITEVKLELYLNKAARLADVSNNFNQGARVTLPGTNYSLKEIYDYIKADATNMFTDATDDLD